MAAERLVIIDATWVETNMAPLRGWGARGERLIGKAPPGLAPGVFFAQHGKRCRPRPQRFPGSHCLWKTPPNAP
jgi:hypothetical protein